MPGDTLLAMDAPAAETSREGRTHPVERLVFFTDAVVAIALTLLILPLMESVEQASELGDTLHWVQAHSSQLLSFVLSFVLIAVFWRAHHRLYEPLERSTGRLIVLNFCWMFTIVWLPVATALSGAMDTYNSETGEYDRLMIGLYVGTMFANALFLYLMEVEARRHPSLARSGQRNSRAGESVALAMTVLFGLAAAVALLFPMVNLLAMFLLTLTGPLQALLHKRMKPPVPVAD